MYLTDLTVPPTMLAQLTQAIVAVAILAVLMRLALSGTRRVLARTQANASDRLLLRRAIEYDPNNRTAHYLLAQLLQKAGRAEEAKQEFAIAERLQGQPGR